MAATDDIEVHFSPERGELSLSGGSEAFARLQKLVVADSNVADIVNESPKELRLIVIGRVTGIRTSSRVLDRLFLWGCGLVSLVFLAVVVVGLGTIIGWIR